MQISDTFSNGLTYTASNAKFYIVNSENAAKSANATTPGGTEVKSGVTEAVNEQKVTWTINDANTLKDASNSTIDAKGKYLVVLYTGKLNENAVIGAEGNANTAQLTYSNNPNNTNSHKEGTLDVVKVYTYKFKLNKIDSEGNLITASGAQFTLMNSEGRYYASKGNWVNNETTISTSNGVFTFEGLDAGTYTLKETKAPDGFNTDSTEKTITISHDNNFNEEQADPTLGTVTIATGTSDANITVVTETNDDSLYDSNTPLAVKVTNLKGSTLPSTGGIGTTLFYILGGVIVAGAIVLLVVKRRRNA